LESLYFETGWDGQYVANSSWHWGSYGSIWIGPHQKNIWTEASEVHMILSSLGYLFCLYFYYFSIGPWNCSNSVVYICIYYTLRFYFPYLSLLSQPVNCDFLHSYFIISSILNLSCILNLIFIWECQSFWLCPVASLW
jgi:hypothetical protein